MKNHSSAPPAPGAGPASDQTIGVTGMTCASCVRHVEKALSKVDGVQAVSVNLATGRARVSTGEPVARQALVNAVVDAGYGVEAEPEEEPPGGPESPERRQSAELSSLRNRAFVSLGIGAAMMLAMFLPIEMDTMAPWLFAAATVVQFWAGGSFYRSAWAAARHGTANMHTLVVVGTSVAYGASAVLTLWPASAHRWGLGHHLYFESSVMIIALVLVGRWLESRARTRAGEAITRLIKLRPKTARVVTPEGEIDRKVETLRVDDLVRVRPGEVVPTDGVIVEGSSTLDESLVTGESHPRGRGPGDRVVGATLNGSGGFLFRVDRVGANTALAQIVRLVEEAQSSKAPIQHQVDRIAAVFVPVVLVLALLTFLGWTFWGPGVSQAIEAAISVLIIACPCALGLATPSAILVGSGRAAELGFLVRNAEALEAAMHIDTIVLDKTGTLTRGKPSVVGVVARGTDEDTVVRLAAAAERGSEHPLGAAIVAYARSDRLRVRPMGTGKLVIPTSTGFMTHAGSGMEAEVEGARVALGNRAFVVDLGLDPTCLDTEAAGLAARGETPIYVIHGNTLIGLIAVTDALKPESLEAVSTLKALGLDVWLVTGDHAATGTAVGAALGIEHVVTEARPEDKARHVADLQKAGKRVAMVGDGINDAPALAKANLGIAIGAGTDVAIAASDITLMSGDLRNVATAIALSRRTVRTIRVGLAWAFGYNIVLIPVAMGLTWPWFGVMLSPTLAAAAMALSSVSVVANALRLRNFGRTPSSPHYS